MTRAELLAISREPNVAAFLAVIRACEGTAGENGYRTLFGGELFDSFDDHPRRVISKSGYNSSAAGAYQFIRSTWDAVRQRHGLPDFSPESQDAGAVALLIQRGALDAIRDGDLDRAVALTAYEWASLPGAPYKQPTRPMSFVRRVFAQAGGREIGEPAPIEARTAPPRPAQAPTPQPDPTMPATGRLERPMSPFVIPALDILARVVPTIADLFKGEQPSKVAERNSEAVKVIAEKVIPLVVAASGAPNIQAAAEAAESDPKVASEIDAAARREYFELQRVSVREAREFAVAYAQAKDVRTVVGRFTFLEFLTLVIVAVSASLTGWLIHAGLLTGELLGAVVTLVLVAGFVDVRKFWLGLPASEPPKDK